MHQAERQGPNPARIAEEAMRIVDRRHIRSRSWRRRLRLQAERIYYSPEMEWAAFIGAVIWVSGVGLSCWLLYQIALLLGGQGWTQ
jgi:hypothetical protein